MTQEEMLKAFNNRWRIKSTGLMELDTNLFHRIKKLCLNFFKTGITIGLLNNEYDTDGIVHGRIVSEDELVYANTFEDFWNLYEKKVGRPKCEKLWEKLTPKEHADCIAYIPLYKKAQPDKQYRKNPETFLRNKSWNDEIIYRNGTDKQQQQRDRLTDVANRIAEYTKDAK